MHTESTASSQRNPIYILDVIHNLDILSKIDCWTYLKVDLDTQRLDRDGSYFWSASKTSDILNAVDMTFESALKNPGPDIMKLFLTSYRNLYKLMKRYQSYEGAKVRIDTIQVKYHKFAHDSVAREAYCLLNTKVQNVAGDTLPLTRSYFIDREKVHNQKKKKRDSLNFKWELHRLLKKIEEYECDDLKEACDTIRRVLKENPAKEPECRNKFQEEIQQALKKLKSPQIDLNTTQKKGRELVNSLKMIDVTPDELCDIKKNLKPIKKPLVTSVILKEAKQNLNKTSDYLDLNVLTPVIAEEYHNHDDLEQNSLIHLSPHDAVIFILETLVEPISLKGKDCSSEEQSEDSNDTWSEDHKTDSEEYSDYEFMDLYEFPLPQQLGPVTGSYTPMQKERFSKVIEEVKGSNCFQHRRKVMGEE